MTSVVDRLAADADAIVNFAAESHVDRSIEEPDAFIRTDVYGTFVLLEAARRHGHARYLQISTDEVYGNVPEGSSTEDDALKPRSPYSASKSGGDLLVGAYFTTYGLPTLLTRASNNFGPYQYPEKVIPLFITNAIDDEPLPLYGDGQQIRDWLYVDDHCDALETVLARGEPGETYNVGGGNELANLDLTRMILELLDKPMTLVRRVEDRPGHDRRYSVDCSKLRALGLDARPLVRRRAARDGGLVSRARGLVATAQERRVPRVLRAAVREPAPGGDHRHVAQPSVTTDSSGRTCHQTSPGASTSGSPVAVNVQVVRSAAVGRSQLISMARPCA